MAELFVIQHALLERKLTRLRDKATPSEEFRRLLREAAAFLFHEASRNLANEPHTVETPLAPHVGARARRPLVLVPILRAGNGLLDGILPLVPDALIGHLGLFRNETTHLPESYYCKLPNALAEADVILPDPMLATGNSAVAAIDQLKAHGATRLRFVCLVSCPAGIARLHGAHPEVPIHTAAVDPELTPNAYISPGLGDAGDRYYGTC